MKIFITGGTGLVGTALIQQLNKRGDKISLLTRSVKHSSHLPQGIEIFTNLDAFANFDQFDAVINLAGEPIFDRYWSKEQKDKLYHSRIQLTSRLSQLINQSQSPPCFISGSAMGIYGNCDEQIIDENHPTSSVNFSAQLCQAWEESALQAKTRVCLLRTGLVLSPRKGALAKILPLYRYGLGGNLGSGKQYWAWIALPDMVRAIMFLVDNPNCEGVFNLVSPNSITNSEFNQSLAKQLKRPAFFAVPACLLKLAFGERACILLDSQNAKPQALLKQGFEFQYAYLSQYLTILKNS